jgi:hypothetical protein
VTASNLQITTTGGVLSSNGSHANGVYNGPFGSYVGGGTMSITNSTVVTNGLEGNGVATSTGGVTTVSGGSITTNGNGSYAVSVDSGGVTKITGTTILTTGNGSGGLSIEGTGSEIDITGGRSPRKAFTTLFPPIIPMESTTVRKTASSPAASLR